MKKKGFELRTIVIKSQIKSIKTLIKRREMADERDMNPYDLNSTSFNPDIFLQKLMKVKRKQK